MRVGDNGPVKVAGEQESMGAREQLFIVAPWSDAGDSEVKGDEQRQPGVKCAG